MPAGGRVRPSVPLQRREGRLLTRDGGCGMSTLDCGLYQCTSVDHCTGGPCQPVRWARARPPHQGEQQCTVHHYTPRKVSTAFLSISNIHHSLILPTRFTKIYLYLWGFFLEKWFQTHWGKRDRQTDMSPNILLWKILQFHHEDNCLVVFCSALVCSGLDIN